MEYDQLPPLGLDEIGMDDYYSGVDAPSPLHIAPNPSSALAKLQRSSGSGTGSGSGISAASRADSIDSWRRSVQLLGVAAAADPRHQPAQVLQPQPHSQPQLRRPSQESDLFADLSTHHKELDEYLRRRTHVSRRSVASVRTTTSCLSRYPSTVLPAAPPLPFSARQLRGDDSDRSSDNDDDDEDHGRNQGGDERRRDDSARDDHQPLPWTDWDPYAPGSTPSSTPELASSGTSSPPGDEAKLSPSSDSFDDEDGDEDGNNEDMFAAIDLGAAMFLENGANANMNTTATTSTTTAANSGSAPRRMPSTTAPPADDSSRGHLQNLLQSTSRVEREAARRLVHELRTAVLEWGGDAPRPDVFIVLRHMALNADGEPDARRLQTWVQNIPEEIEEQIMGMQVFRTARRGLRRQLQEQEQHQLQHEQGTSRQAMPLRPAAPKSPFKPEFLTAGAQSGELPDLASPVEGPMSTHLEPDFFPFP
ncbi:hypothetical protein ACCO45_013268 [Purpureocillium lilacinum]|uniref:Uncharacterized protein n=1 Tax=Purpureocillium lilacinum TaxID=33203 RepID=A0ACC4DAB9_PURLI